MIATSPLTGRIFSGRLNKNRTAFVGTKKDVTGEVLKAIIDKAEFHGGQFDIEGDGKKWILIVRALKDET